MRDKDFENRLEKCGDKGLSLTLGHEQAIMEAGSQRNIPFCELLTVSLDEMLAQHAYELLCLRGEYLYQDGAFAEAVRCYTLAADRGSAGGAGLLSECYRTGQGLAADPKAAIVRGKTALRLSLEQALEGIASAQYWLACCLSRGWSGESDPKAGFICMQKAALKGYAPAQCALGLYYSNGLGVPKNLELGVQWVADAVEQGLPEAGFRLGQFYEQGLGVSISRSLALKYYREAAGFGYPAAYLAVAQLLSAGVPQQQEEAWSWYEKATEHKGGEIAQRLLAEHYLSER